MSADQAGVGPPRGGAPEGQPPGRAEGTVQRREFLKVLGVTGAATTLVGCYSESIEKLIPYVVSPDNTVPGVSNYYATTCRECPAGGGLLVETRDGRAIKAEGNPDHPVNRGALCARGQAGVQGVYNPDRYRGPMLREGGTLVPTTWDRAIQTLSTKLAEARNRGAAAGAGFIHQHEQGSFPAFLDQWLPGQGGPPPPRLPAAAAPRPAGPRPAQAGGRGAPGP